MDAPLGRAIGNALEIVESLAMLKGTGPPDLADVVRRLAARMVVLGGIEAGEDAARARVDDALGSGRALETFGRMVEAQGGDSRIVDDPSRLPAAPDRDVLRATRKGFVARTAAESLGRASHALGAGRSRLGDAVDHAVGLVLLVKPGDEVREGQPLLELHHRDRRGLDTARELSARALVIADAPPQPRAKVLAEVRRA
jgi:thymidine phosphorylase